MTASPGQSGQRQAADEQAALRRVATLAARGSAPEEVFIAVAEEAGRLLSTDVSGIFRYDSDGKTTCVGQWVRAPSVVAFTVGTRLRLGGRNVLTRVSQTGRAARVEQAEEASGEAVTVGHDRGFGAVCGAPITVEGRLWGVMITTSEAVKSLPLGTESRLAAFTDLAAIAIANAQARMALSGFAKEQAALRRVATLVARGAPPEEVFIAVAEEAGQLLSADFTGIGRYGPVGASTSVGGWARDGHYPHIGTRVGLGGRNPLTMVFQTGQSARIDQMEAASGELVDYARMHGVGSVVGVPISVESRLWGAMIAASGSREPLPPTTEERLAGFTQLAAIAIADAQARSQLRGFADEQAALRRVATLVARGAPPEEVFTAVTVEAGQLVPADYMILTRNDPDELVSVIGAWSGSDPERPLRVGLRLDLNGRNIQTLLLETRQPVRVDDWGTASGSVADTLGSLGFRASVGVPIVVEGRLWGFMIAGSRSGPLPEGTEARLAGFTELAATALANAEAHAALTASRARIVAAADQTRRRVEHDLHDGAQQRLVSLALRLRTTQATLPPGSEAMAETLEGAAADAVGLQEQLREISHGLHPAVLAESGLRPALRALARRSAVPVKVDVHLARRPAEAVEIAAYYAVFEALANVAHHARASAAGVEVTADGRVLRIRVSDDGCGGADFSGGSGLIGVQDRVEAFGGQISLRSAPGAGTIVDIDLPLDGVTGPVVQLSDDART
jgi:signal transduction histidine kinase